MTIGSAATWVLPCGIPSRTWGIPVTCWRTWSPGTGAGMRITTWIHVIAGATPDPSSTKATVIRDALAQLERRGVDVGAPLLVGDSLWDVIGGHEAGVPVLGVGWGYATAGGLDDAEEVCESVEELRSFLLSHTRREG